MKTFHITFNHNQNIGFKNNKRVIAWFGPNNEGVNVPAKTREEAINLLCGVGGGAKYMFDPSQYDGSGFNTVMVIAEEVISAVTAPTIQLEKGGDDGMTCSQCTRFYPMAVANQPDGTLKCAGCRMVW